MSEKANNPQAQPHVALVRIKHTGGKEPKYIDPNPEDPMQGEQFTLEHLDEMTYEGMVGVVFVPLEAPKK